MPEERFMHGVACIFVAYVKGKGQGQFALVDWLQVPEPRRVCRIENSAVDSGVCYPLCQSFSITKTCLYNFDPLEPHIYIEKLGFTGVYIIFLIFAQNIDCGYLLEPPHQT